MAAMRVSLTLPSLTPVEVRQVMDLVEKFPSESQEAAPTAAASESEPPKQTRSRKSQASEPPANGQASSNGASSDELAAKVKQLAIDACGAGFQPAVQGICKELGIERVTAAKPEHLSTLETKLSALLASPV